MSFGYNGLQPKSDNNLMIIPLLKVLSVTARMLIMCSCLIHVDGRLGSRKQRKGECPTRPSTKRVQAYYHYLSIIIYLSIHPSANHSYVSSLYSAESLCIIKARILTRILTVEVWDFLFNLESPKEGSPTALK